MKQTVIKPEFHSASPEEIKQGEQEHEIEVIIGNLLRICVILVVIVVLTGVAIYLPGNAHTVNDYHTFRSEPTAFRSVWGILGLAFQGDGKAIIQAGLLLLVLTPILRVVFSVFAFLHEKDFMYVGLTLVVLALLLFSLSGG